MLNATPTPKRKTRRTSRREFGICSPRCHGSGWGLINRGTGVSLRSLQGLYAGGLRLKGAENPAKTGPFTVFGKCCVSIPMTMTAQKKCPRPGPRASASQFVAPVSRIWVGTDKPRHRGEHSLATRPGMGSVRGGKRVGYRSFRDPLGPNCAASLELSGYPARLRT